MEQDVIIVGAGGAGLSAAIVAAHQGLDVLVVEKSGFYGGATAWSGGNVWAPGNSLAAERGLVDDRQSAARYLRAVVGQGLEPERLDAFLDAAPRMVDFFQHNTAVQFELQDKFSDQHMGVEGARGSGRCLTPLPYDGRKLGAAFAQLRAPLEQVNAPFGMMIGFGDIDHLRNATRSLTSFLHVLRMGLRHLRDKLIYSRGTRLTMGNALVARMLRAAFDAGVQLWLETPAVGLVWEGGRVSGVMVEREGRQLTLGARRGVVFASGGFSASDTMRRQHIPFPDSHVSLMPEGNTGDGIAMGLQAGGQLEEGNYRNGDWVVTSILRQRNGSITKGLHTVLDRPKPGCIAINLKAERFANEAVREMVDAMHQSGSVPAYLVCDQRFIGKYGIGLVSPGGFGLRKYIESGYLLTAPDIPGLAAVLDLDPQALQATIDRFNQFAKEGKDQDFGKGDSEQDRSNGDPAHKPNPCLGALDRPPYYAVKIFPGDASTWLGLHVDGKARILGADAAPIPGLYAAGLDANSLWRGHSPSLGANNTLSLTLGYIAATTMAEEEAGQA